MASAWWCLVDEWRWCCLHALHQSFPIHAFFFLSFGCYHHRRWWSSSLPFHSPHTTLFYSMPPSVFQLVSIQSTQVNIISRLFIYTSDLSERFRSFFINMILSIIYPSIDFRFSMEIIYWFIKSFCIGVIIKWNPLSKHHIIRKRTYY